MPPSISKRPRSQNPQITIRKNTKYSNIYDIELRNYKPLQAFSDLEIEAIFYPLDRKITSENYSFYPFEEYTEDVVQNHRSTYNRVLSRTAELFGLLLGLLILSLFALLKPEDLLSVESVISIFAAYTIGKELWTDIEAFITDLTENWPLSFQDQHYYYRLNQSATNAQYSSLARQQRYKKSPLSAELIDFVNQSNSKSVRMLYTRESLTQTTEPTIHLFSIRFDPRLRPKAEKSGFVFAVTLKLNHRFLMLAKTKTITQAWNKNMRGVLTKDHRWLKDSALAKNSYRLGRLRLVTKTATLKKIKLVSKA